METGFYLLNLYMENFICTKCNLEKDINFFSKNCKKSNGINSVCKKCHSEYRRKHYLLNRDKVSKQVRNYEKLHPNFIKSGRVIQSICRVCGGIAYITKKQQLHNVQVSCSQKCNSQLKRVTNCQLYLYQVKKRAEKINKEFNLSVNFLEDLLIKQNNSCAITNVPITIKNIKEKGALYDTASLDRKDSNKGYTEDNVQWVCLGINYMKLNRTDEELHNTIKLIIDYYNK